MGGEWLQALKPGDKVIITGGYGDQIGIVDKITPTGRIVVGGEVYNPQSGRSYSGGDWRRRYLIEAIPERVKKIRLAGMTAKLAHVQWFSLPAETIEAIYALVKQAEEMAKEAQV